MATDQVIFQMSRDVFEAGPDDLARVGNFHHDLQIQLARWQAANFKFPPDTLELMCALGVCEEICYEYVTASADAAAQDAIGDALIFLTQILNLNRLSIAPLLKPNPPRMPAMPLRAQAGRIAQIVLKRAQRIRASDDDETYRARLCDAAYNFVQTCVSLAPAAFVTTAGSVLERDWVKFPRNGKTE